MKIRIDLKVLLLFVTFTAFGSVMTGNSHGAIHRYLLSDHPAGNRAPPTYGLRLDDLQDINNQDFTFSFDHPDARMFLTYDDVAKTIHIAGKAFGGRDIGTGYDASNSGLFEIKFTYREGVIESSAPSGLKVSSQHVNNNGSIEFLSGSWQDTQTLYNLTDYQGSHSDSFRFLADGHRISGDSTTMVGRGWVNHDGDGDLSVHDHASDWLFKGELVPEPFSYCVWGTLAIFGASIGYRKDDRRV